MARKLQTRERILCCSPQLPPLVTFLRILCPAAEILATLFFSLSLKPDQRKLEMSERIVARIPGPQIGRCWYWYC